MSGHLDCTQIFTVRLDRDEVLDRVRAITELKIPDKWWFGMLACTRDDPLPEVTVLQIYLLHFLALVPI